MPSPHLADVHTYHNGTKHHFQRFARSLGYLDWASQPNPFRSFQDAAALVLPPRPDAPAPAADAAAVLSSEIVGNVLRYALGLTAWKQFGRSRWPLRANPSSGNLHPTEAYVIAGAAPGLAGTGAVYHYAADCHELEQRCAFDASAWDEAVSDPRAVWLIALTSIHWREAWKYGERAFRYCQHDMGHAIAAVRIAAEAFGWRARILPEWSHDDISAVTGINRDEDFVEAEREEPGCILVVGRGDLTTSVGADRCVSPGADTQVRPYERRYAGLIEAVRRGCWTGRANQLSEDHVEWTFIDEIAAATRDPGCARPSTGSGRATSPDTLTLSSSKRELYSTALMLQRRSAVSLDGQSSIDAARFFRMLGRVMPAAGSPFDALWWDARIHLALFVHRVDGLDAGLYLLPRHPSAVDRLKTAVRQDYLWEAVAGDSPLVRLARVDARRYAQRASCDQEIAADGFFSLGMIADFDASLETFGPSFYRHLFWESGSVGQVLYLEAEAAGARGTGIGCFYDDPVHDLFGFTGHAFQSLYHFTIGIPVEDTRLTTSRGYAWEAASRRAGL